MNNPEDFPVIEDDELAWMRDHHDSTGKSWRIIADESGIKSGTLSNWANGTYLGVGLNVAKKVFKYRQMLESQALRTAEKVSAGVSDVPSYIETPTGRRLKGLMVTAHSGEITYAGTGPGTGKTKEAENYCASASNAIMVTMKPTTKSLTALLGEIIRALGGKPGVSWARQMSAQVIDMVKGRRFVLIVDEANWMEFEAIEELRALHDLGGLGICLLGNEELHATIEGGAHRGARHSYARLNSRIAMRHVQDMPLPGDIDAYLDAWGIEDGAQRQMLMKVGLTPGVGGLREIRQLITNASMLALSDEQTLSHSYLREAMSTRATRHLRLAS
ncbi:MAG: AAA family ATPase [Sphingopyxis sp.]|uniref:AAA family ATPase n=1 Tax=Sphingopyxis sp. TaxID=1908224 RepID=UPI003D80D604